MKIARQQLLGSSFPIISNLKPVSSLDDATLVHVAIALPVRDEESRTALLRDMYDPASTQFRQFLSPSEYTQKFEPTEASYQGLLEFAKTSQLNLVSTSPPKHIHVSATAATINKVFNVTLQQFQHPAEDRLFYAPSGDPELAFETPGLQITGLDNFQTLRKPADLRISQEKSSDAPRVTSGSGINGWYTGKDFRAAYAPGVTATGKGQVVGVLETSGYLESDIRAYEQQNGIPNVKLQNVYLDGYTGANPNNESAADIELVISMAPGLSQVTVYGVSYSNAGIIDILHEMTNPTKGEPLPNQITTSYWFFYDKNVYDALARLAAQGQAFFVASGDNGSFDEQTGKGAFPPVDHPLVTAVGGTELVTSGPGGAYISETTASFSGGGYSPWKSDPQFAIPWWQSGMDYTISKGSSTVRNVPDVSIVADSIAIFFNGSWQSFGGTSAAAPLWAGFLALVNEQATTSGRPPIGFANPALWSIGRSGNYTDCFHDITAGNNFNSVNPNLYNAVVGYDLCTGWGSPKGQPLIDALVGIRQTKQWTDSSSWIAPSADGRLNVFARGSDGALWQIWQTVVNGGWSNWLSHGSPAGTLLNGSPVLGRNADGRLQVFVSSAGSMWSTWQTATSGNTWNGWVSLSKPATTILTDSAVVASNTDGRLELFAQGADQALWHIWQNTPNGGWSNWASQGKPSSSGIQGSLCLSNSLDGRLELFAIGNDGALWHIWQTTINGGWSSWFSHGSPPGTTFAGSTIPPVAAAQADGRQQLFIPTLGGDMWRLSQTVINGGWSTWISHGRPGILPFSDPPTIAANQDGRLEFYIPIEGDVWHIWQESPNGSWSAWFNQISNTPNDLTPVDGSLALAPNVDGRLELVMLGFNKAIWHIWQITINSGWSAPASYGTPPKIQFQANR